MAMKKISFIIMLIVFSMFNFNNNAQASVTFTDLSSSHPAFAEINYLVNLGVLEGSFENGKRVFKPSDSVTRGQAAKMAVVATGQQPLEVTKSTFSDIDLKTNAALSGYVERAIKLSYFNEYSKGKFEPKIALTRYEMSKVLAVAFQLNVEQTASLVLPFKDIAKSDPYYKYIAAIYYNGITVGASSDVYNPKGVVTRAQFSSFVARASSNSYRLTLPVQAGTVLNEKDAIDKAVVTVNNLNVRSSTSSTNPSNILGKVNSGKVLSVFEDQGYWLKVAYNGQYGYVAKEYTKSEKDEVVVANPSDETAIPPVEPVEKPIQKPVEEPKGSVELPVEEHKDSAEPPVEVEQPEVKPEQPSAQAATIGIATVNNLNIRDSGASSGKVISKINRDTKVNVLSIDGYWAKVEYNGTIGYIDKRYLRLKNAVDKTVKNRIIVIDPGHGGKDPGAVSGTAVEKEIALKVSKLVQSKLQADGAKVLLTRSGDTYPSLDERPQFATKNSAEMFISIHVNSVGNTAPKGTETYYSVTSNDNEKEDLALATSINNQIVKNANMNNRGVKREDYRVIKNISIPAILVELGFVSNAEDRAKLVNDKYVEIFAQSIYNGIVEYYAR